MERKDLENVYINQFNEEFGSNLKLKEGEYSLLITLFNDYVEQTFKGNKLYNEILRKLEPIENELIKSFSNEQKELFDKWNYYTEKYNGLENEQSFIYGFCLDKELTIEKKGIKANG